MALPTAAQGERAAKVLLLTSRPALSAAGVEQVTGRLGAALRAFGPAVLFELLPYPVPPGLGLSHPFSRTILARYGAAGILPEALSLKQRLLREIEAERPSAIALLDDDLLPLAVGLRLALPEIRLCRLSEDAADHAGRERAFHGCDDLFDSHATYSATRLDEAIRAVLGRDLPPQQLPDCERIDAQAVFNPLSRLFATRLLCRAVEPDAVSATVMDASGAPCDNTSLEYLAAGDGWTLFQLLTVLPEGSPPEAATLTLHAPGRPGDEVVHDGPLAAAYHTVAADILAIARQPSGALEATWWYHRDGVALQRSSLTDRQLDFRGHALTIGRQSFAPAAPVSLRVAETQVDFPDAARLFDGASDAEIAQFKDIHRGETAWLIGNGPSVRHQDLERLAGRLTFGFNRLHLAYGDMAFRPSYVVSADRQMIADFGDEIVRRSEAPVFLADAERPAVDAPFRWLRQVTCFPSVFSLDPASYVTAGGSTVYVAMQLAFFMGVRKFYLYGADFRFSYARNGASGDRNCGATGDGNHFIPNYRSGLPWSPPELRNITTSFVTTGILMRLHGGFLRNATRGGALEIFERVPFEDALAEE